MALGRAGSLRLCMRGPQHPAGLVPDGSGIRREDNSQRLNVAADEVDVVGHPDSGVVALRGKTWGAHGDRIGDLHSASAQASQPDAKGAGGSGDDKIDPLASGVTGHRREHPEPELISGVGVGEIEHHRVRAVVERSIDGFAQRGGGGATQAAGQVDHGGVSIGFDDHAQALGACPRS
jgi:hypothetical protein